MIQAIDFLVWQGYPPEWVLGLTLRQFLATLEAASKRAALRALATGLL